MQNSETTDVQFVFDSTNTPCFSSPHDTALTHMYIFSISVLILDPSLIKLCYASLADWTTADEHKSTSPLQVLLVIFLFFFFFLNGQCVVHLMWNGWSPKRLKLLKSRAGLASKPSLITKAVRWARGIEVTSPAASKTCRICRGSHGHCLLCRCAASDMFWRSSEGLRALRTDAICPRYSQHAGDADNERHVEFGTTMGAVCNQRGGLGAVPIGCRRS